MSRRFVVRPEAEAELDEAAAWYSERSYGLGADSFVLWMRRSQRSHGRPFGFRKFILPLRRAVLRRFPYTIMFRVTEEEIVVLSVFHSRRDPKRWTSRS